MNAENGREGDGKFVVEPIVNFFSNWNVRKNELREKMKNLSQSSSYGTFYDSIFYSFWSKI